MPTSMLLVAFPKLALSRCAVIPITDISTYFNYHFKPVVFCILIIMTEVSIIVMLVSLLTKLNTTPLSNVYV